MASWHEPRFCEKRKDSAPKKRSCAILPRSPSGRGKRPEGMKVALAITGRRKTLRALVALPWAAHAGVVHCAGAERQSREILLRRGLLRVVEHEKKVLRRRLHGIELLLTLLWSTAIRRNRSMTIRSRAESSGAVGRSPSRSCRPTAARSSSATGQLVVFARRSRCLDEGDVPHA